MFQYILRRIYLFMFTLLILTMISYSVYLLSPLAAHSGFIGWFQYLQDLFTLNIGVTRQGSSIYQQLLIVFPATLELCFFSISLALLVGLPVGTIAGMYQGKRADTVISFVAMIGYSIPVFWLALIALMFFSANSDFISLFERYQSEANFEHVTGFAIIDAYLSDHEYKYIYIKNAILNLLLPSAILAFAPTTEIIRLMRNAVADVKQQNYIRTARIRGLNSFQIIFKRVLRNAVPQVIPKMTIQLAGILTYVMIIEFIFDWPGIGLWLSEGFRAQDYMMIQAAVLVLGTFVLLVNVLSDFIGMLVNPLIRKQWNGVQ